MNKEHDIKITRALLAMLERAIENADFWQLETAEEATALAQLSMARNGALSRLEKLTYKQKSK